MTADLHTLTGAYAVDSTLPGERALIEQHLAVCDACRQEVAELQATACRLAELVAEEPPAGLRDRVLTEIDRVRQESPFARPEVVGPLRLAPPASEDDSGVRVGDTGAAGRRQPRWRALLAPAATVAALAVLGVSLLAGPLSGDGAEGELASSRVVEVLAAPDADTVSVDGPDGSSARLVRSAARGEAVLVVDGMAPAPHDHTYELWLLDDDAATSAGLFDVDADGRSLQLIDGDLAGAAAVGVTVEPDGGSPQPTTDPLMLIEIADA